jgi:hypothetical protein
MLRRFCWGTAHSTVEKKVKESKGNRFFPWLELATLPRTTKINGMRMLVHYRCSSRIPRLDPVVLVS